jgi:hypothetical protein
LRVAQRWELLRRNAGLRVFFGSVGEFAFPFTARFTKEPKGRQRANLGYLEGMEDA